MLDPTADEADVEKILGILLEHTEMVASYFQYLIFRFPNIVKQLYKLAGLIEDKETLTDQLAVLVEGNQPLIEYQLFWIAVIAEDWLSECKNFGKLIMAIYEKTANHKIARAKVLEIPNQTFGLKEIREEVLKSGASDWQSWAAAVGTRTLKKAARNHALKYFAKGSPLNYLIAQCVQGLP